MTVTVQRILNLMEHYGTSGAFISSLVGKSRTLVAGWKNGSSQPTDSDIATISDLYGVSQAYLRGESDDPGLTDGLSDAQKAVLEAARSLSNDELKEVLRFIQFLRFNENGKQ